MIQVTIANKMQNSMRCPAIFLFWTRGLHFHTMFYWKFWNKTGAFEIASTCAHICISLLLLLVVNIRNWCQILIETNRNQRAIKKNWYFKCEDAVTLMTNWIESLEVNKILINWNWLNKFQLISDTFCVNCIWKTEIFKILRKQLVRFYQ